MTEVAEHMSCIYKDSTAMHQLRRNFWIILAVTIIIVSLVLGFVLYYLCRWLIRKDKKLEITNNLKQNQRDEEKMYENVHSQLSVQLPPLPPRRLLSPEDASPQEAMNQLPATYSSLNKVRKKKKVSIPSYFEPEDDYDDVEISTNMANNHSETTISSFSQIGKGSHNLF
ncbi:SLP adapter and CSK-interacting membrane protein [Sorex araneus]|uniref:SLP adapter and CSK-interacting membrane protein n=1 Tax=Sorex araneus TaxID=42254 RepID=UPI0024336927|nr:SLP adapter and CSK-interacting membrane protein [Sorex araneus]